MNLINMAKSQGKEFDQAWVDQTKEEIGADLMGVLAVTEDSHPDFLTGVKTYLPSAKAAVVLAVEYSSETMNLLQLPKKFEGKVPAGALLTPHVNQLVIELNTALGNLTHLLKKQGYRSLPFPSRGQPLLRPADFKKAPNYAKALVSYAHIAEAAGMGTVGTHSLLITPEFGTRARLAALLTEAPLQTTKRIDPIDDCTHCLDCVSICPVGAISMPAANRRYQVAADKCKFYRERIDNCGMCQKACSYATGHSEATGGPLIADPNFLRQTGNRSTIVDPEEL